MFFQNLIPKSYFSILKSMGKIRTFGVENLKTYIDGHNFRPY